MSVTNGFTDGCPTTAPFWGFGGASLAIIFANLGAAYGTAKSGIGIAGMGVLKPEMVMKCLIPVVMAGVVGIYGLIIAVIISTKVTPPSGSEMLEPTYSGFSGFAHFAAGAAGGLSGLAAGYAIGIVGDAGVRSVAQEPKLFVGMILILIFAEALGLYGLIVALIMSGTAAPCA